MKNNHRNVAALNAKKLVKIATEHGARSLGIEDKAGQFEVGQYFDFVGFNIKSARFKMVEHTGLIDALVFGCGNDEICIVGVGGKTLFKKL